MVAVVAAALVGAAVTAFVVIGGAFAGNGPAVADGSAAGLRIPATSPSSPPEPMPSATPATTPPEPTLRATSAMPAPEQTALPPTRVVLSRLGIDMAVEPQGVDEKGQMGLPADPTIAGWYRFGATPQDAHGAVVVAAHVDSKTLGVGPFSRLGSAQVGDEVRLDVGGRTLLYRVTQVARVDKAQLDEEGLFSLSGPPRLHLVTCTGDYVTGQGYRQNLVVVAERLGS